MRLLASLACLLSLASCGIENDLRPNTDANSGGQDLGDDDDTTGVQVQGEPVADAGDDLAGVPLQTVTLDGTRSYDPEGNEPLKYSWRLVDAPAESISQLENATSATPRFWIDFAGDYTFELTVTNTAGKVDSTPDRVVVSARPLDNFYVELAWDTEVDLDLHLAEGSAQLFSMPGDCNFCNMTPNWANRSTTADDPSLDWDAIEGYGPETVTITDPATGVYRIMVHYYGQDGMAECWGACPDATATVRIYIDGELAQEFRRTLHDQGDVWSVAELEWPSAKIEKVDLVGYSARTSCY
jgi:hypothetical protein